jgi:hypothetical protein
MPSTTDTIPALCIRQPWAHCILHLGKVVEIRTWPTKYRGPLVIVASMAFTKANLRDAANFVADEVGEFAHLHLVNYQGPWQLGGIVGMVELVDCVTKSRSPWFDGSPFGFVLKNPIPVPLRAVQGPARHFPRAAGDDAAPVTEACVSTAGVTGHPRRERRGAAVHRWPRATRRAAPAGRRSPPVTLLGPLATTCRDKVHQRRRHRWQGPPVGPDTPQRIMAPAARAQRTTSSCSPPGLPPSPPRTSGATLKPHRGVSRGRCRAPSPHSNHGRRRQLRAATR